MRGSTPTKPTVTEVINDDGDVFAAVYHPEHGHVALLQWQESNPDEVVGGIILDPDEAITLAAALRLYANDAKSKQPAPETASGSAVRATGVPIPEPTPLPNGTTLTVPESTTSATTARDAATEARRAQSEEHVASLIGR
jgi:hypothetical protein